MSPDLDGRPSDQRPGGLSPPTYAETGPAGGGTGSNSESFKATNDGTDHTVNPTKGDKYGDTPSFHGSDRHQVTDEERRRINRGRDRYADVAALLAGDRPARPRPLVLSRNDGHALLYTGEVNVLFGEQESAKTMLALAATAEVAKAGRRTAIVDVDHNGDEAIIARLIAFGVPDHYLGNPDRFRYVEPEDADDLLDVVAFMCREWRPAAAVVDSVGELLPMLGSSSNSPDDYTRASRAILQPLAHAGSCVVAIDHVNRDGSGGPSGTVAKTRAPGGSVLRVKVKERMIPGVGGMSAVTVFKDRHGGLREHCPRDREPLAGMFRVTAQGDRLDWNLHAPNDLEGAADAERPNDWILSDDDLAAVSAMDPPPTSVRDLQSRQSWGSPRARVTLKAWRERNPTLWAPRKGAV